MSYCRIDATSPLWFCLLFFPMIIRSPGFFPLSFVKYGQRKHLKNNSRKLIWSLSVWSYMYITLRTYPYPPNANCIESRRVRLVFLRGGVCHCSSYSSKLSIGQWLRKTGKKTGTPADKMGNFWLPEVKEWGSESRCNLKNMGLISSGGTFHDTSQLSYYCSLQLKDVWRKVPLDHSLRCSSS